MAGLSRDVVRPASGVALDGRLSSVVAFRVAMSHSPSIPIPRLARLPSSFPAENAVRVDLEEGVPVFRATASVQARIEELVDRQRDGTLTTNEAEELDSYEALDDHLSLLNRLARNPQRG